MELESGVPIPAKKRYPFDKMNVGDSVYFDTLREVENAASAAYSYGRSRQNGFRVMRQKMPEGGYRLWRVE